MGSSTALLWETARWNFSFHRYPEYLSYCIGLDSTYLRTALEDGSNGNKMLKTGSRSGGAALKKGKLCGDQALSRLSSGGCHKCLL